MPVGAATSFDAPPNDSFFQVLPSATSSRTNGLSTGQKTPVPVKLTATPSVYRQSGAGRPGLFQKAAQKNKTTPQSATSRKAVDDSLSRGIELVARSDSSRRLGTVSQHASSSPPKRSGGYRAATARPVHVDDTPVASGSRHAANPDAFGSPSIQLQTIPELSVANASPLAPHTRSDASVSSKISRRPSQPVTSSKPFNITQLTPPNETRSLTGRLPKLDHGPLSLGQSRPSNAQTSFIEPVAKPMPVVPIVPLVLPRARTLVDAEIMSDKSPTVTMLKRKRESLSSAVNETIVSSGESDGMRNKTPHRDPRNSKRARLEAPLAQQSYRSTSTRDTAPRPITPLPSKSSRTTQFQAPATSSRGSPAFPPPSPALLQTKAQRLSESSQTLVVDFRKPRKVLEEKRELCWKYEFSSR